MKNMEHSNKELWMHTLKGQEVVDNGARVFHVDSGPV